MSYFDLAKHNKEVADSASEPLSFENVQAIQNYTMPDDSEESMDTFFEAIMDFVYNENTSMEDKVAAVKVMAKIFGENPDDVDAAYVTEMMEGDSSEEAKLAYTEFKSHRSNRLTINKTRAIRNRTSGTVDERGFFPMNRGKEMAAKWFGARELTDKQTLKPMKIGKVFKANNKKIKDDYSNIKKSNMKVALSVIDKIGKTSGFKVKTLSKSSTDSGMVEVAFSVSGAVQIDQIDNSFIKINKTDEGFMLRVGV